MTGFYVRFGRELTRGNMYGQERDLGATNTPRSFALDPTPNSSRVVGGRAGRNRGAVARAQRRWPSGVGQRPVVPWVSVAGGAAPTVGARVAGNGRFGRLPGPVPGGQGAGAAEVLLGDDERT